MSKPENSLGVDMPGLHIREQIWARDVQGLKHAITVVRAGVPGSPHLPGPPRFTWGAGRSLDLVDERAGILECRRTRKRLKIEDWGA